MTDDLRERIAAVLAHEMSHGLCPLDGPCRDCDCHDPTHTYERCLADAVMTDLEPWLARVEADMATARRCLEMDHEGQHEELEEQVDRAEKAEAARDDAVRDAARAREAIEGYRVRAVVAAEHRALKVERDELRATVARLRHRHRPEAHPLGTLCTWCRATYPCPVLRDLDGGET